MCKGGYNLKLEYLSPKISVELLNSADVLLESGSVDPGGGDVNVNTPTASRRENRYFSFADFQNYM